MSRHFKLLTAVIGGLLLLAAATSPAADQPQPPAAGAAHQATEAEAATNLRQTLDPMQFTGPVREAYKVARENPDLLVQLHCYCGCDRTNGHKNLLDCYRDHHGASCSICTGEALEAKKLFDQGASIETIREALRARFAGKSN